MNELKEKEAQELSKELAVPEDTSQDAESGTELILRFR